jgi:pyrroline-5-carboxylate reductase
MAHTALLVGCGNMGRAMLRGWLDGKAIHPADIHVVEPNDQLRTEAEALGVVVHSGPETLDPDAIPSLIILAVKPQMMSVVVPQYRNLVGNGSAILSIAAGTTIATFEALLGATAPIIRCMPNTPAAIGMGMMAYVTNGHVSSEIEQLACTLLAANGAVAKLDEEEQIDAVTAISGSGPAYVFHMIEALTDAGTALGLPAETAVLLARQTVRGAGALAAASDVPASTLRQQVTSPNGTTAAGLAVLMQELPDLMTRTAEAAHRRSVELRG